MTNKKIYGLLGNKLEGSFSPNYFANKFKEENILDCSYHRFHLDRIEDFVELVRSNENLHGLNVTTPYKEAIVPYMDELSVVSKEIGAVNTIIFKNGKLIGDNTDVYGFKASLLPFISESNSKINKALILGSGGASKAVQYVLKQLGIDFQVVSRRKAPDYINYRQATKDIIQATPLIINTTPLGMSPDISSYPKLKYQYLNDNHLLYDLVYNPPITTFMQKGIDRGSQAKSGGDMLAFQAEKSWELWNM